MQLILKLDGNVNPCFPRLDQLAFTGTAERVNPESYASCASTPCDGSAAPLNVTVTLGLVMNMCSLLDNNSDLTRELVEQNFAGNSSHNCDCWPILRKIVRWQAHHHSYATGHGRPHSRHPLFLGPVDR